eukprot:1161850-Pelagomonas_calceolata.AAC.15
MPGALPASLANSLCAPDPKSGMYTKSNYPEQRHIDLVKVKDCEDTSSTHPLYHLLGVDGVIYTPVYDPIQTPHTSEPLKELGLDAHAAIKLDLKLHAHSFLYAYKLASTRRALENASLPSLRSGKGCC